MATFCLLKQQIASEFLDTDWARQKVCSSQDKVHLFPSSPAAPCLLLLLLLVALFSSFSSFLAEEADGALSLLATPSDTFREETSLVNDDTCKKQKRKKKQIIFFISKSTAAVGSRLGRASTMLPLDRALTLCLNLLYVCISCFLLPYTCILCFLLQ